jgi:integrase
MKKHLTQTVVNSIKPDPDKPIWITDTATKNLKLYVGSGGTKAWYVYYRDNNGKKASHKIGGADIFSAAQARDLALVFLGQVKMGETPQKKKHTDNLLLKDFLARDYEPWAIAERKSGAKTLVLMRAAFKQFLDKPVIDLSIKTVEKWRQDRMRDGSKAATCNRRIAELKAAFNWGMKREFLESNPLDRLEKLKEHDSDIKVRYLTDDERVRLMATLGARELRIRADRKSNNEWRLERGYSLMPDINGEYADHMKPMILVSLNTGIRQGNLFALLWGDIDFERKTFMLRAKDTKGGKTLHLPMNSAIVKVLAAWREQSADTLPEALVFPSPKTGGLLNNVKTAWHTILRDAEIENFRWHDMRHDFASQLVMRGADLNTVRELMGHTDLKMTMRYAHLAPNIKQDAVELLTEEKENKIIGRISA